MKYMELVERQSISNEGVRIGTRLKHARLTRGLTLQDLADIVGCSVSTISKIENQRANPSVTMLHRMCTALGTNMSHLFAPRKDGEGVVTPASERPVITTDQLRRGHGILLERLVPYAPGHLIQGNIHVIEPQGYSNEGLQHEGEEVGYVIEGVLELTVNNITHIVNTGDSFFFTSDSPHSYRNPSETEITRVIWVNSPPTF